MELISNDSAWPNIAITSYNHQDKKDIELIIAWSLRYMQYSTYPLPQSQLHYDDVHNVRQCILHNHLIRIGSNNHRQYEILEMICKCMQSLDQSHLDLISSGDIVHWHSWIDTSIKVSMMVSHSSLTINRITHPMSTTGLMSFIFIEVERVHRPPASCFPQ